VTVFSHMTRDVSGFLSNVTRFLDCFFGGKLPQFHTSNFRKVVRQHTEGMVGSTMSVLLEIYLAFEQLKNFENQLRNDKVIAMSLVYYFFGTVHTHTRRALKLYVFIFLSFTFYCTFYLYFLDDGVCLLYQTSVARSWTPR